MQSELHADPGPPGWWLSSVPASGRAICAQARRDVIRKGAFVRTLDEQREPLPLFWQHRTDVRIGWVERIAEDERGLRVIASIDNPEGGAAAALKQGTANGLSFGYRARGYLRDAAGRELTDIDLYEVSLVSHPMQHAARVHMVEGGGERKANFRHYRENGQFARAGEGILYGSGAGAAGTSSNLGRARVANSNGNLAMQGGETDDRPNANGDIVVNATLESRFDAVFEKPKTTPHTQPQLRQTATHRAIRIRNGKRILQNPIVDYGKINSDLNTRIDFSRIVKSEGGVYLDSYVPWPEKSAPNNNSGVTIVGGLDLGGKNAAFFDGVPRPIVSKMSGAFGLRKAEARDWNTRIGISFTPEEGELMQEFLLKKFTESAAIYYNGNKNRKSPNFVGLTPAQQTVFYDRFFNAGPRGVGSSFFSGALRGDWASAANSLRSSAAANPTWAERMRESADLIDPPARRR